MRMRRGRGRGGRWEACPDAFASAGALRSCRRRVQAQTERAYDLEDGGEFRVARWRERLVQTLSPKPGLASELRHALGARNVAKRRGDQGGVALLERRLQVGRHVFFGLKMLCRIPAQRL